jgi:hypothetical protein
VWEGSELYSCGGSIVEGRFEKSWRGSKQEWGGSRAVGGSILQGGRDVQNERLKGQCHEMNNFF